MTVSELAIVFVVIAFIGALSLLIYLWKQSRPEKEDVPVNRPEPPKPPRKEPEPVNPPEPPKPDPTIDELYAMENRLWLCPYCETLNPYPPGYHPARKAPPIPAAAPAGAPGLTGTLLRKVPSEPEHTPELFCAACGKRNIM